MGVINFIRSLFNREYMNYAAYQKKMTQRNKEFFKQECRDTFRRK